MKFEHGPEAAGGENEVERLEYMVSELERQNEKLAEEKEKLLQEKTEDQLEIEYLKRSLKEQNKEIEQQRELATKDPLTGLYNRRGFGEAIETIAPETSKESGRDEAAQSPVSILHVDIDNFKEINDLYGHAGGDQVLKELGEFLSTRARRRRDIVGRLGGEEFAIALNGTDEQKAFNAFYNEERKEAELSFETTVGGERVRVTLSGGIAQMKPGEHLEETLERADQALYESKTKGKDRLTKWSDVSQQPKNGEK